MLHGMIPAAFFATLLRRYLDSLSETPEYTAPSSSVGCLGTSAVVATVGMAAYGISRLSRKSPEMQPEEINETIRPPTIEKKESSLHVNRRPKPRKTSRKRHRKDKRWFLKHMRHYKSKYGRQIGRLMNQFLGVPFSEQPTIEPLDLDSEEDDEIEDQIFDSTPYISGADPPSGAVSTFDGEDSAAPGKDRFDEDGEDTECTGAVGKKSSSVELKDLLRDNFEMQRKRRSSTRGSSRSQRSRSSSGSYKSGCSDDTMVHNNSRSSSRKRRFSVQRSRSNSRTRDSFIRSRGRPRRSNVRRKTRSGRCYDKASS